ncbi:MAG TPA: hypothetical protein EYO90_02130 [Candidatus Latescibacteria bacterium]|nr:hypothetical protein [Candidatus Latescibacterota bacterium]
MTAVPDAVRRRRKLGADSLSNLLSDVKKMMDTGAWGLLANTATMALVSGLGKDPTKATPLTPAG